MELPVQFVTYRGIGHEIPDYIWDDLIDFFKANAKDGFVKINPHN